MSHLRGAPIDCRSDIYDLGWIGDDNEILLEKLPEFHEPHGDPMIDFGRIIMGAWMAGFITGVREGNAVVKVTAAPESQEKAEAALREIKEVVESQLTEYGFTTDKLSEIARILNQAIPLKGGEK